MDKEQQDNKLLNLKTENDWNRYYLMLRQYGFLIGFEDSFQINDKYETERILYKPGCKGFIYCYSDNGSVRQSVEENGSVPCFCFSSTVDIFNDPIVVKLKTSTETLQSIFSKAGEKETQIFHQNINWPKITKPLFVSSSDEEYVNQIIDRYIKSGSKRFEDLSSLRRALLLLSTLIKLEKSSIELKKIFGHNNISPDGHILLDDRQKSLISPYCTLDDYYHFTGSTELEQGCHDIINPKRFIKLPRISVVN